MTDIINPILLCGGSGTRLWPLSRKSYPKQFVKIFGEESLFQASARRISAVGFASPSVVTASDFRFMVVEQLAALEIEPQNILIEPSPVNTAAAICAAAIAFEDKWGDSLLLITPTDHLIPDSDRFRETIKAAIPAAKNGQIVTFGILPDRAETGYGWLELKILPEGDFDPVPQPLSSFVEKPDAEDAKILFKSGMHLWNAGIFLFSTSTILNAFAEYAPEMLANVRNAFDTAQTDLGFTRLAPEPWSRLESISIDHAIMERAEKLWVVP